MAPVGDTRTRLSAGYKKSTAGVVMNVRSRASRTNIENTVGDKIPAERPTLRTISSTSLNVKALRDQPNTICVNLPFAAHKRTDRARLTPRKPSEPSGDSTATKFAGVCEGADSSNICPSDAVIEKS